MNRKRIAEEVIEIMCEKLHRLPLPGEMPEFDYESQKIIPNVTSNDLDIAEVSMDLEDAFGINFHEHLPGDSEMETIGAVINYIHAQIKQK